jgi:IrrE N-terminal-like domain
MKDNRLLAQFHRSLEAKFARSGGPLAAAKYEVVQRVRSAFAAVAEEFPPTDIDKLSATLGVTSIRRVPLAVDGRLRRTGAGYTIEVNRSHSAARQRFTIAHEIAHLILVRGGPLGSRRRGRRTPGKELQDPTEERLCDYAAAEILMPSDWVWAFLSGRSPSLSSILEMARTCRTSLEAAAVRLVEAGPWRCRLIWWQRRGERFAAYRSFPLYDPEILSGIGLADPQRSIVAKVLNDGKPRSGVERILIGGEVGNYSVESWRGGRLTVTSLLLFDRMDRPTPRQGALFAS